MPFTMAGHFDTWPLSIALHRRQNLFAELTGGGFLRCSLWTLQEGWCPAADEKWQSLRNLHSRVDRAAERLKVVTTAMNLVSLRPHASSAWEVVVPGYAVLPIVTNASVLHYLGVEPGTLIFPGTLGVAVAPQIGLGATVNHGLFTHAHLEFSFTMNRPESHE